MFSSLLETHVSEQGRKIFLISFVFWFHFIMSSKTKSKRSSPKTSGKAKDCVRERKNPAKIEEESSTMLDFGSSMASCIKEKDVKRIVSIQNKSLKSFMKTNELLGKFNDFSSSKYDVLQHMFVQHTRLLVELKKDLTNVFLRIRCLKVKLQKQHPEAFEATFNLRKDLEDRLELEIPNNPTYHDKTKMDNVDDGRKNETDSLSNKDQILSLKSAEKDSKFTKQDNTSDITNILREKKVSIDDEEHCRQPGMLGSNQYNIDETKEADHVLLSQESSSKNVVNNCVDLKSREVDPEIVVMTENWEIIKKEGTDEKRDNIGKVEVDFVETEDDREQMKDDLEMTKEELEDGLQGNKDNVGKSEDSLGVTEDN